VAIARLTGRIITLIEATADPATIAAKKEIPDPPPFHAPPIAYPTPIQALAQTAALAVAPTTKRSRPTRAAPARAAAIGLSSGRKRAPS
jgi:hypothetical protein